MNTRCIECGFFLPQDVFLYSTNNFGYPLCRNHQDWIRGLLLYYRTTQQTVSLYLALKCIGVPVEIEKYDGYKHIDIAIPRHKINIEIDGLHHNYDSAQALRDLKRTYHSFRKGFFTIRIPNSLIDHKLDDAVDCILNFLNENKFNY